ncbi:hypothetical protein [Rickettsiella massiliensis]|uniref:hypothetical protein n=1 Tax=Rickettsiella massiliensis TaxID=676517 RepID=UPI0012EAFAFA|nr:hypothetical protein [Rickettsiella massiliensis]
MTKKLMSVRNDATPSRLKKSLEIEDRRQRLKFLRTLTGLSMKEFAQHCHLGLTTVNYWEQGYSSITERGAKLISNAMQQEGIACTPIWLLYVIHPKLLSRISSPNYILFLFRKQYSLFKKKCFFYGCEKTKSELEFFQSHYPDHWVYFLQDESMSPLYHSGDIVAGKKITGKNMELAHRADCIVEMPNNQLLIRRIQIASIKDRFNLYVINPEYSVELPPLRHVEIRSLAPIIRIFKPAKF